MKINKKILISSILAGILSMGAGVGTYTAFTAKVKSVDNKIETVTYTINKKVGEQSFDLFALNAAVPGSTAVLKGFEAKVTGNKEMSITPNIEMKVSKRALNNGELADTAALIDLDLNSEEAKYFEINTVVKFGSDEIFNSKGEFVPMKSFMDAINGAETKSLLKDEMFRISDGLIRINSAADNDYQGATVEAKLNLTAGDLVVAN
jgi:hypothetical protein